MLKRLLLVPSQQEALCIWSNELYIRFLPAAHALYLALSMYQCCMPVPEEPWLLHHSDVCWM